MRRLETALTAERQRMPELARNVYGLDAGAEPTRAQIESVRRAAKRLADQGRAEVAMRYWENRVGDIGSGRYVERGYLTARTPLTEAERKAELEQKRQPPGAG